MVVEGAISSTSELVLELGKIGKWVQAVGLFVIAWLIIQLINLFINKKRLASLRKMESNLQRLERKMNKLSKKNS
tara:strand:+ start:33 stop:257 length:225 start_codon:yes stop_codon:yes gene_type:complete